MDPSENQIDQIGFEYATDGVIIFSFCTLTFVKDTFRKEYDQKMIIRFLWNGRIDVHKIAHRLQRQFDEHVYAF
jgi:hypothetical protein